MTHRLSQLLPVRPQHSGGGCWQPLPQLSTPSARPCSREMKVPSHILYPTPQQFRRSGMRLSLLLHPAAPEAGQDRGAEPGEGQQEPREGAENREDPCDTAGNCATSRSHPNSASRERSRVEGDVQTPRAGRNLCAAPHPPTPPLRASSSLFTRSKRI